MIRLHPVRGDGALPETVGDAGLLADPEDPEELAAALLAAACDDDVRGALIEAGRRRAAHYSWARTAAMTDAAIGDLLSEGSEPVPQVLR